MKPFPLILYLLPVPAFVQMAEPYIVRDILTVCVNVRPVHESGTTPLHPVLSTMEGYLWEGGES